MSSEMWAMVVSAVALIIGTLALAIGATSLAFVVGLKNSTHNVVFQPLDKPEENLDPFAMEEESEEIPEVNPNKRVVVTEDEEFADLSDPTVTSNNW